MSGADVAIRSSERADGSCRGDETEIVHVVGECGGLCQLATVSQGIDFFLKRWKPVDGQRAPAIGVDPADDRIVPEYWSGMLNLRVERVSAPR